MNKLLNITVLFGGQSTEHEVSILSARNVVKALASDQYQVSSVYVTETGQWYYFAPQDNWLEQHPTSLIQRGSGERLLLLPGQDQPAWVYATDLNRKIAVDCVFPLLHGTLGEDGALQGLLEMLGVAYVGSDVVGSAICISKQVTKQLLRAAGVAITDWIDVTPENYQQLDFAAVVQRLGLPLFVKPANLGSSVGMTKVSAEAQFQSALKEALYYSHAVIIESYIDGREIECAVLGNQQAQSSVPGEIISHHEFYTYAAKYLEPEGEGATLRAPADLDASLIERFKQIAVQTYHILQCQGMARVDFFLTANGEILVNEVNTLPGFTDISMYPRLWQLNGLRYPQLLDKLIQLALMKQQRQQSLIRIYRPHATSPMNDNVASS